MVCYSEVLYSLLSGSVYHFLLSGKGVAGDNGVIMDIYDSIHFLMNCSYKNNLFLSIGFYFALNSSKLLSFSGAICLHSFRLEAFR